MMPLARSLRAPLATSSVVLVPFSFFLLSITCLGTLQAAVTSIDVVEVPQNLVPGYTTYDVKVTGTGQLTVMQMFSDLDQGSFFQHPQGHEYAPPHSGLVSVLPPLAFDTFVTSGTTTQPSPVGNIGGALNIGGYSFLTFSQSKLDVLWFPDFPTYVYDPVDFLIARLTISDDASGTIKLRASVFEDNSNPYVYLDHTFELPVVEPPFDFSGDYIVDGEDLSLLLGNWGKPGNPRPPGWDGLAPTDPLIDGDELSVLLGTWGQGVGSLAATPAAIPEPATLVAAILCITAGLWLRGTDCWPTATRSSGK